MRERTTSDGSQPGLSDLFRKLGDHASALVRGEVALAKLELRDAARSLMRDSSKLAVAFTLAWFGGLALTAALIIGVAHLLDGRFGLAALLVGVLFLLVGGLLARSGMRAFDQAQLRPAATIDSLVESRAWAKREIRQFKQDLTGPVAPDGEATRLPRSTEDPEHRTLST